MGRRLDDNPARGRPADPWRAAADLEDRLNRMVAETDGSRLLTRLAEAGGVEDVLPHAFVVRQLLSLDLAEPEAEAVLDAIVRNRARLRRQLGHDPGLCWAALDHVCNQDPLLASPALFDAPRSGGFMAGVESRTGLLDPGSTEREVRRELSRARRHGRDAALLLVDLDRFGEVNLCHGPRIGDAVLEGAARALKRALRESDVVGRSGGDEFLVVLPRTGRLAASAVAERVRRSVAADSCERPLAGRHVPLTLSVGIGCIPGDADGAGAWVDAARTALARAKGQGRDRVVAHPSERRAAVRLPATSGLRGFVIREDGTVTGVRLVELGPDGVAIDGLAAATAHELVRIRIETEHRPQLLHGRVVRRDARTGRTAIALAERLPGPVIDEVLGVRPPRVGRPVADP